MGRLGRRVGFLQVDLDALRDAVASLRRCEEILRGVAQLPADGDLGPHMLTDSVESFARRWEFGADQLVEAARVAAANVATAHDSFRELDATFAEAVRSTSAG